jgi:gamma-glutamyltranspeptidase/glutathione hydrolase
MHRYAGIVSWMLVGWTALSWAAARQSVPDSVATARKNMVATVHPLATEAALAAFDQGGNAVDAAIAAALTLGVVDGYNSGIGGGCFILIRRPDHSFVAIDGRDMAPLAATRDMFLQNGRPDANLSLTGPLAVAVPGALAAYERAVRDCGALSFSQLIGAAAAMADDGFPVGQELAGAIDAMRAELDRFPGNRGNLLGTDGSAPQVGQLLCQPDLAQTYRNIGAHGVDWFYRGPFAQRCGEWFAKQGGILTAADFAAYQPVIREPLISSYRGFEVVGFPPPSSGGVHVAQILNVLENFPIAEIHAADPVQMQHVMAEAMKLAFADRAFWLGDPAFTSVPRGLVHKDYARQLAARIDMTKAQAVPGHGDPALFDASAFGKHTTHVAASDADGYWVALTTTVNTTFGSKVVVPGTGVVLNNQMDDFAIAPGLPNAFGLVGGDANAIEPGKRPLSSMSPTIVCRDGQPLLTVGAAGGPKIITQVVQVVVRIIDLELSPDEAVGLPRIHHQWSPDVLYCEPGAKEQYGRGLTGLGHTVRVSGGGVCQAIVFDQSSGQFIGVADPRVSGKAAGR